MNLFQKLFLKPKKKSSKQSPLSNSRPEEAEVAAPAVSEQADLEAELQNDDQTIAPIAVDEQSAEVLEQPEE